MMFLSPKKKNYKQLPSPSPLSIKHQNGPGTSTSSVPSPPPVPHPQSVPHNYKFHKSNKRQSFNLRGIPVQDLQLNRIPIVSPSESIFQKKEVTAPKIDKTSKIDENLVSLPTPFFPHFLQEEEEEEDSEKKEQTKQQRVRKEVVPSLEETPVVGVKARRAVSVPCLRQKRRLFVIDEKRKNDESSNSEEEEEELLHEERTSSNVKKSIHFSESEPPRRDTSDGFQNTLSRGNTCTNDNSLSSSLLYCASPSPLSPSSKKKKKTLEDSAIATASALATSLAHVTATPPRTNRSVTIGGTSSSAFSKYSQENNYAQDHQDDNDNEEVFNAAHVLCKMKSDKSYSCSPSSLMSPALVSLFGILETDITEMEARSQQYQTQEEQYPELGLYRDLTRPSPSRIHTNGTLIRNGRNTTSTNNHHRSSLVFSGSSSFSTSMTSLPFKRRIKTIPKTEMMTQSISSRRLSKRDIYDRIVHSERHGQFNDDFEDQDLTNGGNDNNDDGGYHNQSHEYEKHHPSKNKGVKNKSSSLPNRLALPNDRLEVNSLHCYVRSELLELFVVPPTSNDQNNRMKGKRINSENHMELESTSPPMEVSLPSSSPRTRSRKQNRTGNEASTTCTVVTNKKSTVVHTSTNRRNIPGRVGLRCVHCKPYQTRKQHNQYTKNKSCSSSSTTTTLSLDATKADFYPRSLQQLYREVCTWQRVHFQHCPHIPKSCRDHYKHLKESDKTRGKTRYWESSARELGLVNAFNASGEHDGIRFK